MATGGDVMGALRRFVSILAVAIATALLVGACASGPGATATPATPLPPLSISNGTSIPITLVVNGTVIETVPPGDRQDPITAQLPQRPWVIETQSPSGRMLSTLMVSASDHISATSGRAIRVDLACGRLDVWAGPPLVGPAFSPGPSGDCG